MASIGKIARRTFLFGAAAIAGGAAFGYYYYRSPYANPLEGDLAEGEATFNPFVKIASDNTITVIAPRAEMGQGVSTTLAALVAEELEVDLDRIKVEHGPADFAYFNATMLAEGGPFAFFNEGTSAEAMRGVMGAVGKIFGVQGTGGSASTRDGYRQDARGGRRDAPGADRRCRGAARRAGRRPRRRKRLDHCTRRPGRSVTYGAVAADAAKLEMPSDVRLKDRTDWKILGKPQPRKDMLAKVTGAPIFGIDVDLARHALRHGQDEPALLGEAGQGPTSPRPRRCRASSRSCRSTRPTARASASSPKTPGRPSMPPMPSRWSGARPNIRPTALRSPGRCRTRSRSRARRCATTATSKRPSPTCRSDRLVEAEYSVPFLAHACMEPMNATARLKDGVLDLWSPNQFPTVTRYLCADLAGVERDKANVHTTFLGGGFGRRGEIDFSMFATLLAREAGGRPVKVTWTREEDTRHDVYRPAAVGRFRARLGDDGMPVALDMRIASPSIMASMMRRVFPSLSPMGPDKLIVEGSYDQPYTLADYRVVAHHAEIGIPVGAWRSVGNSFNGFFHESFLDEVAAAGKVDPVAMRRKLMAAFPGGDRGRRQGRRDGEMGRGAAGRQGQGLRLHAVVRQLGRRDRAGGRHAVGHPHRKGVDRRRSRHRASIPASSRRSWCRAPSTACRRRWARRSHSPTASPNSRTSTISTPCA